MSFLDPDRGFALAARASVSVTDVIDPTIWVKEKISVALGVAAEGSEPPLRLLIDSFRSIHAELMRRPERDRPWVAVLALAFHGGDGVLVSAGDCPCFRYRAGLLSRLKRLGDEDHPERTPRGALGSESQVRIEVVPLRPEAGDVYLMSTRPLREGELMALAAVLAAARDGAQLLRAGVEGSADRGRIAVRILAPGEDASLPARAEALADAPRTGGPADAGAPTPLEIAPLHPAAGMLDSATGGAEAPDADSIESLDVATPPDASVLTLGDLPEATPLRSGDSPQTPPISFDDLPDAPPPEEDAPMPAFAGTPAFATASRAGEERTVERAAEERAVEETPAHAAPVAPTPPVAPVVAAVAPSEPLEESSDRAPRGRDADGGAPATPARPRELQAVEEERPWYEPLALWGGGALAIIALALLLRAILPGILGTRDTKGRPAATAPATGTVDFLSDPPGAIVRVDGEALAGRTPLASVTLDPGLHKVELDWGVSGVWRDTLELAAGSRLVIHPAIYGTATFRSSDETRVLDVYVDGEYAGTTPLTIARLVAGRHLVRFGGPGLTTTAGEVDVLRDTPVELVGNAGAIPEKGRLTVRSAILSDTGFQAGKNDPVWIDGVARGATPLTAELAPGIHSVRVVRRDFPAQVTVLDVQSGGEHFVNAEFGANSAPPIAVDPPAFASISNPLPITISLPAEEWDESTVLWLCAAPPGGSFQAKRMTLLEDGERTYAGLLPPEVLRNAARKVRFFVKATGATGREYYSEIVTIPVRD
ncbi:MAG TPA: PEGA domain-containing protein [Candidatus Eisenbacteria bacterium]